MRTMYKLHGVDTVEGLVRSANTSKFYETYGDALDAAKALVSRASNPPSGIVIFQSIAVVHLETPPICVTAIESERLP